MANNILATRRHIDICANNYYSRQAQQHQCLTQCSCTSGQYELHITSVHWQLGMTTSMPYIMLNNIRAIWVATNIFATNQLLEVQ